MTLSELLRIATTPSDLSDEAGLAYWRGRILHTFLFVSVVLGALCLVPSVVLLWKQGLWGMIILDTALYTLVASLFLIRTIPFFFRALGASSTFYLIGTGLIFSLGPGNTTPWVWYFTFPLMVVLLLGIGPAWIALLLNLGTLVWAGFLIHHGFLSLPASSVNWLADWTVTGMNFLTLNTIATVSFSVLLRGLETTLDKERNFRVVQEHERVLLREANEKLVRESAERQRLAEKLREHGSRLEVLVEERTRELQDANRELGREIQEHKRAERLLWENEEKYTDLYDHAPDMYVSVDARTARVIQCNQTLSDRLGYTKGEIIGRPVFDLYHPESLEAAERVFQTFAETGEIHDEELQLMTSDGTRMDVSLNVSAVRDESGGILHSRSCWRDITVRKRLEAQISKDAKLKSLGIVAGGVAHNYNNILMAVLGYQEMALAEIDRDSTAGEFVRQAYELSLRAREVSGKMLAYTGIAYFTPQPVALSERIHAILPELEASRPGNVALKLNLDHSIPFIRSDPEPLRQIVLSLATNAWEALGEEQGGDILINTGSVQRTRVQLKKSYLQEDLQGGEYVFLEIVDPGEGIAPEILDKIFDPFFTTRSAGRGLGLSSVMGIVRAHGGAMEIQSNPGRGTLFRVLFPVEKPRAASPS